MYIYRILYPSGINPGENTGKSPGEGMDEYTFCILFLVLINCYLLDKSL